jgi:adenosylcobyric acid synthase
MRVALHCNAACLLVTDIDRGGAFAHLYGTWALLPQNERALIKGFVLNKFRGDPTLLAPAPQLLQDLTGVPTVAVLPMWWQHGLPEEDGVFDDRSISAGTVRLTVAVVAYPRISNLDEFQPLKNIPGLRLMWVRSPSDLAGLKPTDWVILPGSKSTSADLTWLRQQGLDAAVTHHARQGGAVLGVCGGLQMLGEALIDTHGIDGNAPGLGLLPLVTQFASNKTVRRTTSCFVRHMPQADPLSTASNQPRPRANPWSALEGVTVSGYEIHHGQTVQHPAMAQAGDKAVAVLPEGLGWSNAARQCAGSLPARPVRRPRRSTSAAGSPHGRPGAHTGYRVRAHGGFCRGKL